MGASWYTEADVTQGRVADVKALVDSLDRLVDGEGGIGSMTLAEGRQDKEKRRTRPLLSPREGRSNLVPARIQSITCTLMHTEKQTLSSGKRWPGQERLHRPAVAQRRKICYTCASHGDQGKRTKGINRNGKERGHLAPAGALSTRRS